LSIAEYRELLEKPDMSDEEIQHFLDDLHSFLNRFLDDYFHEEIDVDMEK
jgi:hypothetical protein